MQLFPVASTTYSTGFTVGGISEPSVNKRVDDIIPQASNSRKVRVMANEGDKYIIYVHDMQPGSISINFPTSDAPGTQYRVYFFDPVIGGSILPTPNALINTGNDVSIPFVLPSGGSLYSKDLIYYIERV